MTVRMIRALVVDDEPLARRGVIARLSRHRDLEVVAECGNGRQAAAAIRALTPDVVFLDVQMPGADGFDLVASIGSATMPLVVLITAHNEHALRAFDIAAIDYLLKPIDDERFDLAIERVRKRIAERELAQNSSVSAEEVSRAAPERIIIKDRGRVMLLEHDEVFWVEAEGDYVRVHAADNSYQVRTTLSGIAAQLPADIFVRIHRSTLVNRHRVREMTPLPNREFTVLLTNGTSLRLSRTYQDQVALLTGGR